MRPMISKQNVSLFLRQNYNVSTKQFFEEKIMQSKIIAQLFGEFTGCELKDEKLTFHNPYTDKQETFEFQVHNDIESFPKLMKQLVEVHKERMQLLEQSYRQEVELTGNKKEKSSEKNQREAELEEFSQEEQDQELEQ